MNILDILNTLISAAAGFLISYYFYNKSKKKDILTELDLLLKDVNLAYKNKNERKNTLIFIAYCLKNKTYILGDKLVYELEDVLFKNLENKTQTVVEIKDKFRKYYEFVT
ncbi:hypothetical protein ACMC96_001783 [Campylobacter coli]|nr:hypothetical protein [Campylobacter jejuni]EDO8839128.1 hypothetical protein [Campylobacter coli]EDO9175778.1 hypothetical protein [Campylobacter coli]HEC1133927.1 hypothetical protein [Campylobacter coli]HED7660790.1 hypothetical protein [Campylobacter coli]